MTDSNWANVIQTETGGLPKKRNPTVTKTSTVHFSDDGDVVQSNPKPLATSAKRNELSSLQLMGVLRQARPLLDESAAKEIVSHYLESGSNKSILEWINAESQKKPNTGMTVPGNSNVNSNSTQPPLTQPNSKQTQSVEDINKMLCSRIVIAINDALAKEDLRGKADLLKLIRDSVAGKAYTRKDITDFVKGKIKAFNLTAGDVETIIWIDSPTWNASDFLETFIQRFSTTPTAVAPGEIPGMIENGIVTQAVVLEWMQFKQQKTNTDSRVQEIHTNLIEEDLKKKNQLKEEKARMQNVSQMKDEIKAAPDDVNSRPFDLISKGISTVANLVEGIVSDNPSYEEPFTGRRRAEVAPKYEDNNIQRLEKDPKWGIINRILDVMESVSGLEKSPESKALLMSLSHSLGCAYAI